MTSKVYLALFLLVACTVTVSAVEDNFPAENGEKFSPQNAGNDTIAREKCCLYPLAKLPRGKTIFPSERRESKFFLLS